MDAKSQIDLFIFVLKREIKNQTDWLYSPQQEEWKGVRGQVSFYGSLEYFGTTSSWVFASISTLPRNFVEGDTL